MYKSIKQLMCAEQIWSINLTSATYFCLELRSCSCLRASVKSCCFLAQRHKDTVNMKRINCSTSITARLGLAGRLIGLILKIHRDGRLHENKQLKGVFVRVYVCKRVLKIQSSIFLNTCSRPSANISTASIGRQSGCHHIVGFLCRSVSKQS